MNKITLYNVVDIRTNKFHSVVKVRANQAKWFVAAEDEDVTA